MKISKPKALILEQIRSHLTRGKTQLSRGNRRLLSAEALHWVERGTPPSASTDMDTLTYIRGLLSGGIPALEENKEQLEGLRLRAEHLCHQASLLWKRGDGGKLPATAAPAYRVFTTTPVLTSEELKTIISQLEG